MKHVKSTDPRKVNITAAFKKATGCNKVTDLYEVKPETQFKARCLKSTGGRQYEFMGTFGLQFNTDGSVNCYQLVE